MTFLSSYFQNIYRVGGGGCVRLPSSTPLFKLFCSAKDTGPSQLFYVAHGYEHYTEGKMCFDACGQERNGNA